MATALGFLGTFAPMQLIPARNLPLERVTLLQKSDFKLLPVFPDTGPARRGNFWRIEPIEAIRTVIQ
jgi:hypothetical protein